MSNDFEFDIAQCVCQLKMLFIKIIMIVNKERKQNGKGKMARKFTKRKIYTRTDLSSDCFFI